MRQCLQRRSDYAVILSFAAIGFLLLLFLSPILWMFLGSFKDRKEFFTYPPIFFPKIRDFSAFVSGLQRGGAKGILDTVIISGSNTLISIGVGAVTAYGLARFRIGGKNFAFWILSIRMLPPIAIVLPLFIFYQSLNWVDTYQALILTHTAMNIPFAVWMLKGFFEELPADMEDSALVDGCSHFQAFYRVALPLIAPGLVATALFCFIFSWNELLFSLVLTRGHVTPLALVVANFIGSTEVLWGLLSAVGTIASLPAIILAIFLQRYLVRGLTLGAVKG